MPKGPTKLYFTEEYSNDVESSPKEEELIVSNLERPPTPILRRLGMNRKPADRLYPSPSLTQVGKFRICSKKLRRSKSPAKKMPTKRSPVPKIMRVPDEKVLDQYSLVQIVCIASIAAGEGALDDI